MDPLEPPDTHYLSAAMGWLELGNRAEAKLELAKVARGHSEHPNVLEVSWSIAAAENDWADAWQIAERLVRSAEDRPVGWLHRAYAVRRAPKGGLEAAWNVLLPAADLFPKEATIPYNLACYACQMGKLGDARVWLRRAMSSGDKSKIRLMANADPDLQPLWGEVDKL
jgi:Flp pilus assembly protein TadD